MSNFFNSIIAHGDTIVVALVAIILGIDKLTQGKSSLRKEINEDYKERNKQLEDRIKEFQESLNKTNLEVAGFKATIIEKDKRIAELRDDLQGRNPEVLKVLKEISEFMKMMHADSIKKIEHQTAILESQVKREELIDKSSADHTGDPLRIGGKNI